MDLITSVFVALSSMLERSLFFMVLAAFIWGILSIVLSPCHISSIPLVVGYVNRNGLQSRGGALRTSLYFSGGVLVSLLVIGVALGPCTFGFMFPVLAVVFRAADQNLPEAIAIASSYAIGHTWSSSWPASASISCRPS